MNGICTDGLLKQLTAPSTGVVELHIHSDIANEFAIRLWNAADRVSVLI